MHRLNNRNLEAMTADCSECGPRVPIVRSGKGGKYFQCAGARRRLTTTWDKNHPARAAARKRPDVGHQIIAQNLKDRTGYCTVCRDIVNLVPFGAKGLVCQNRPGVVNSTEDPFAELRSDRKDDDPVPYGFQVTGLWADPYYMPEYESAVPGWKTLGKNAPHEPRHAAVRS